MSNDMMSTPIIVLLESSSEEDEDLSARKPPSVNNYHSVAPTRCLDISPSSSSSSSGTPANEAITAWSDDDDDDDDDDIPTSSIFNTSKRPLVPSNRQKNPSAASRVVTMNDKEQRRIAREQERQRKHQQKEREKYERQEARKRQRQDRQEAKAAEKQANKDRKQLAAQRMGKFAQQEVCVIVNPILRQATQKSLFDDFEETYETIVESRGIDIGAIQFIRRDFVDGGAKAAKEALEKKDPSGYELSDRLLIVVNEPNDFLELMDRSDTDDDFPKLEEWLEEKIVGWKRKWQTQDEPKILVLLPGIIKEVHRRWNNASARQRPSLMTDADLQDAIIWLLVAFQVECQPLESMEQVLATTLKMTRAISEKPYARQVTELECVRKIKSTLQSENPVPVERAQDAWLRMVQQVPSISATRAEQLVSYYPTANSLWQAYQGKTEEEKALLVAHLFDEKRQYRKLSEHLSIVMTGTDPNKLLS